jgi:hypothetical protein
MRFSVSATTARYVVPAAKLSEFNFKAPHGTEREPEFKDILAGVEWAPDPGNEATWRPVSDWVEFE